MSWKPAPDTFLMQGEANTAAALRAFHPDEVSKQEHLTVDTKYYLQHQVHAVVSRLCEPIEGLGAASIAEFLGLDPSGYRSTVRSEDVDEGAGDGEGCVKVDPFEGVALPLVTCQQCEKSVEVQGFKVSLLNNVSCLPVLPYVCQNIIFSMLLKAAAAGLHYNIPVCFTFRECLLIVVCLFGTHM